MNCIKGLRPGPTGNIDFDCEYCEFDESAGLLCGSTCPRCESGELLAIEYSRASKVEYHCPNCGSLHLAS